MSFATASGAVRQQHLAPSPSLLLSLSKTASPLVLSTLIKAGLSFKDDGLAFHFMWQLDTTRSSHHHTDSLVSLSPTLCLHFACFIRSESDTEASCLSTELISHGLLPLLSSLAAAYFSDVLKQNSGRLSLFISSSQFFLRPISITPILY